jgi:hypothetical protein
VVRREGDDQGFAGDQQGGQLRGEVGRPAEGEVEAVRGEGRELVRRGHRLEPYPDRGSEPGDGALDEMRPEVLGVTDADLAAVPPADLQRVPGGLDDAAGFGQERLAGRGEGHAPAGTGEMRAAQLPLQTAVRTGVGAGRAHAILTVVDADKPPLRVFFGKAPIEVATRDYESRLETWRAWQPVSAAAHGA